MRIAIYGREFKDDFIPFFQLLIDELDRLEVDYYVYSKFHKNVKGKGITLGLTIEAPSHVCSGSPTRPSHSDYLTLVCGLNDTFLLYIGCRLLSLC